ncbi:unnamed protein product [Durusdinium trenchii]|uniref:Uncharacterized protein n=1 Tax=Durusdinium trenchii TaxID=1381693 RepID=A0ABP0Q927_9DINO
MSALELFSVTVLGSAKSGKTTLINAFISHSFLAVPEETLAPELYYKTMSVPAPSGTSAPPIPILVEIEDTFAPSAEGVGLMEQFLTSQRDHVKSEHLELLAGFNLPEAGEYRPLSKTRMGFLLVFDVWSEASLQEAIKLHRGLQDHGGADGSVLCLVGNKADRAAGAQEQIRAAQRYAAENELMFFQLAATDLRKVRLLFRQLLSAIYAKPQLWRLDRPRRRVGSRVEEIDHVDYDDGGNPVEDTEALEQEARQAEEALRHLEATRAPERRDEVPTAEMAGPEGAREEDLAEMPPEEHAADEVPSEPAAQTAERPRSSVPMVVRKVPDPTEEEVRSPRGAAVEHEVPPQIHEPAPMPEEGGPSGVGDTLSSLMGKLPFSWTSQDEPDAKTGEAAAVVEATDTTDTWSALWGKLPFGQETSKGEARARPEAEAPHRCQAREPEPSGGIERGWMPSFFT